MKQHYIGKNMEIRDIAKNIIDAFMCLHICDIMYMASPKYLHSFIQQIVQIGRKKHKQANTLKEIQ